MIQAMFGALQVAATTTTAWVLRYLMRACAFLSRRPFMRAPALPLVVPTGCFPAVQFFWKVMGKPGDNNGPSAELKSAIGEPLHEVSSTSCGTSGLVLAPQPRQPCISHLWQPLVTLPHHRLGVRQPGRGEGQVQCGGGGALRLRLGLDVCQGRRLAGHQLHTQPGMLDPNSLAILPVRQMRTLQSCVMVLVRERLQVERPGSLPICRITRCRRHLWTSRQFPSWVWCELHVHHFPARLLSSQQFAPTELDAVCDGTIVLSACASLRALRSFLTFGFCHMNRMCG